MLAKMKKVVDAATAVAAVTMISLEQKRIAFPQCGQWAASSILVNGEPTSLYDVKASIATYAAAYAWRQHADGRKERAACSIPDSLPAVTAKPRKGFIKFQRQVALLLENGIGVYLRQEHGEYVSVGRPLSGGHYIVDRQGMTVGFRSLASPADLKVLCAHTWTRHNAE